MGKKFSKILKGEITSSVFYTLLGLCLLLIPVQSVNIICKVVFGLMLISAGCYHLYVYVRGRENTTILDLFTGVIVLVLGGFLFFNPQIVVKLLPLLLGAFVLVDSIWTLQGALRLKKRRQETWKAFLIGSLIFVGLGIAVMVNPFTKVRFTVMFAGAVLLANGAVDFVFFFLLRKGMKAEPKMVEEGSKKPAAAEVQQPEAEHMEPVEEAVPVEEAPKEWKDVPVVSKVQNQEDTAGGQTEPDMPVAPKSVYELSPDVQADLSNQPNLHLEEPAEEGFLPEAEVEEEILEEWKDRD